MELNEYELIVSQPKNPLWKIIICSLFFSCAIYSFLNIVMMNQYSELTHEESSSFLMNIMAVMVCLTAGFYTSVRLTILIDTDKEILISRYFLGFFTINKTSEIPNLKNIVVSKTSQDIYMINLWYDENKFYNMCYSEEKDLALNFAQKTASILKIDMLNNTEKGNPIWTYKINS